MVKLDISKAFDTVSWPFLLEVLQARGFDSKWIDWISALLSTASSKVLLNGCPGLPIAHRRGVRQGDPLSPMLFIVAMDIMDRIFTKATSAGILQSSGHDAILHQCRFYADDVILFASPSRQEGRAVDRLLNIFAAASGLHINRQKCSITPFMENKKTYRHSSRNYNAKSSNSPSATWVYLSPRRSSPDRASGR